MKPIKPLANLAPAEREQMARAGAGWQSDIQAGREVVLRIYTPRAAKAPKDSVDVRRDQPYGEHPRQVLDLFVPSGAQGCDVVVFVHGGAFVRGDKRINDEVYDNLCYWFARQGVMVANLEYRLAGEAPYPGGAEDVGRGVDWCFGHVGRYGGNPARIFLIGHSAGATHVGTYLLDPVMQRRPCDGVIGAISMSGRLRADVRPGNPNAAGVRAYFGADTSLYETRSPVAHVDRAAIPFLVAFAEFENPLLDAYSLEFARGMHDAQGRMPEVIQMKGHNHTSMTAHFNCGEDILGQRILAFMRGCSSRPAEARQPQAG